MRWPFVPDAALERRVRSILDRMSTAEKVGQLIQANIDTATPGDVHKYHLGSVLASGNTGPDGQQFGTPRQWLATADAYYRASIDTHGGNAGIPVLFGFDAVHGANKIVGATLFPHNIGLGAARDPELVRAIAAATAQEMRAAGITWSFAPDIGVPRDARWGRAYEGFAERPDLVARYAAAAVEGLQGKAGTNRFLDSAHVLATAKHFVGDGATADGRDQGDAEINETALRDSADPGYATAIAAGVQTVMVSLSSWRGERILGNAGLLTGVLKQRMHFGGFVLGDRDGQALIPGCNAADCAQAYNAGADMLMAPDSWRGLYANTLREVESGTIPMRRLDDAVARILRVKLRLGLFDEGAPSSQPLAGKFDLIASPAHRALARRAVRESLVLLKNAHHLLPLDPKQRVLVAGDGANNIPKQCGGWTLNWQGDHLSSANFPNAQSIWDGLRQQIEVAGGSAQLSVDGTFDVKPDVAIVVFGEDPYAEYVGDLKTLAYKPGDTHDLDLMKRLRVQGIPVVAVFLTGRPLWVTPEIDATDAFVVAWLPGTEGGGIADMLLRTHDGRITHDFRGKLPFAWPRTPAQATRAQRERHGLFPYGFGLTYAGGMP